MFSKIVVWLQRLLAPFSFGVSRVETFAPLYRCAVRDCPGYGHPAPHPECARRSS